MLLPINPVLLRRMDRLHCGDPGTPYRRTGHITPPLMTNQSGSTLSAHLQSACPCLTPLPCFHLVGELGGHSRGCLCSASSPGFRRREKSSGTFQISTSGTLIHYSADRYARCHSVPVHPDIQDMRFAVDSRRTSAGIWLDKMTNFKGLPQRLAYAVFDVLRSAAVDR